MANVKNCLRFIPFVILILFFSTVWISPISAKTVTLTAQPFSGLPPLEVKFTCYVGTSTSRPTSYKIIYDDGTEETLESNQYSCTFTHTYQQNGLFKPTCIATKDLGITSSSDPIRVIVAKWKFETNGQIESSAAVGQDGTVYIGSDDFNLYDRCRN
jgi:PKD repeat protein